MSGLVSVIIPAYNEQESLAVFLPKLVAELKKMGSYEIIVINDGSSDQTAETVLKFHKENPSVNLVSLSRNFGAQAALCAGYREARGDCVISMDADMQHPISALSKMLDQWRQGYDIVCAIRRRSNHLGLFKRISAGLFYRLFKSLTGLKSDMGADFRLMSRSAVNALNQFSETPVFLRGLVSRLGFRQCTVYYDENKRQYGGPSRYTLKKMLNLALTGILGFSLKPLHLIFLFGLLMMGTGIIALCAVIAI